MKRPQRPPRVAPYKAYALQADGSREPIGARSVVVEIGPDVEIEIELAPHPRFAGHLVLYTPATSRMKRAYRSGKVDDFAVVFGASNVLHVVVERRRLTKKKEGR
jgi:hypothetical protein